MSEGRNEADYEALRSYVVDGEEICADNDCDLTVIMAHGTAAWVQQCHNGAKTTTGVYLRQLRAEQTTDVLTMLFANIIESAINNTRRTLKHK